MKLSILAILSSTFTISAAFAGNIPMPTPVLPQVQMMSVGGPTPSPTFPEKGGNRNITFNKDVSFEGQYSSSYFTSEDLSSFDSVKTTITDDDGNSYSFIQFKQHDGSYNVFISQSVYEKMKSEGEKLNYEQVTILTDKQYILLSKQVQLNTFAKISSDDYMGGEAGRCAAGTIGSAIGGAIAGGAVAGPAVAGPAGAVAGAVGGALYGSAGNCR